jgi:hypothetical protein
MIIFLDIQLTSKNSSLKFYDPVPPYQAMYMWYLVPSHPVCNSLNPHGRVRFSLLLQYSCSRNNQDLTSLAAPPIWCVSHPPSASITTPLLRLTGVEIGSSRWRHQHWQSFTTRADGILRDHRSLGEESAVIADFPGVTSVPFCFVTTARFKASARINAVKRPSMLGSEVVRHPPA